MRRTTATLLLISLTLAAGCRREAAPPKRPDSPILLVLLKSADNPFFQEIERGIRDGVNKLPEKYEVYVRAGTKEGDVTTQRRVLDDFIGRYVTGHPTPRLRAVFLTPSGSAGELVPQIKVLKRHGVTVILVDTQIAKSSLDQGQTSVDTFIGSNNKTGGAKAAAIVVRALPKGGRVLLLNGVAGQETAAARRDGFVEKINSLPTKSQFTIEERTCNWRRSEAYRTVDSLLGFGKRFDAIFAANDEMALGAVEAIRQYGKEPRPVIVGFDAIDEAVQAVKDKRLAATLAQDPYGMGIKAVDAVARIWKGDRVPDQLIDVVER